MKRLVIAAVVALALPAFAAEEADKTPAQPQKAEKAAPAKEQKQVAKEQVASQGISKDVTLEAAPGNGGTKAAKSTLRFERWVKDEDKEAYPAE